MFSRFVVRMPSDPNPINQLLARAGMIMEDASAIALIDDGALTIAERIAAVRQAGWALLELADAAEAAR